MSYSSRLFALLCLSACVLAGVACLRPDWAQVVGLEWRGLDEALAVRREQVDRAHSLEVRSQIIRVRLDAKIAVVQRVIAREMSLFEAAAWFRHLNENPVEVQDDYRSAWPGNCDGEKVCRQVIGWVFNELHTVTSPSLAIENRARMEKELAEHIARHGQVILPAL